MNNKKKEEHFSLRKIFFKSDIAYFSLINHKTLFSVNWKSYKNQLENHFIRLAKFLYINNHIWSIIKKNKSLPQAAISTNKNLNN